MGKWIIGMLVLLVAAGGIFWSAADQDMRGLLLHMPTNKDVLFWSISQRDAAFRAMDRMPVLTQSRIIPCDKKIYPLSKGVPLEIGIDVQAYMKDQRTAALVIVHKGRIRLAKYGLEFRSGKRWTSFSVAKSITSTLVGAAIKDGHIRSIDDKVPDYIPDLRGSAYDDVTIKQLLTMTSGVKWNEDYGDPRSDVALFNVHKAEPGIDVTVSYMRKLKHADTPGRPGYGYGYQWWTWDDGSYMARGIFGQGIFIDPKRKLVIASNGNWPRATDRQGGDQGKKRIAFYKQVQLAIDRETAP